MLRNIVLAISLLSPLLANSAQIPSPAGYDSRITVVPYNKQDVVELAVKPGIVTQVVFGEGEEYKAHAIGDSEAWHLGHYDNFLFIKPAQPLGTTNLSVVTNKHHYMFKVNFVDKPTGASDMYQVEFIYPEEQSKEQVEAQNKQVIEERLEKSVTKKIYNLDYSMKGDRRIAPVNVYDDGTFTYFKFAGNTDLPAVYSVVLDGESKDGKETIVNKTVEGNGNNIVVMHKVNYLWRLRLGRQVLDIYNDNMNWVGTLNETGTIAPDVERVPVDGGDESE